jgi:type IV secretory pathway VirJ component
MRSRNSVLHPRSARARRGSIAAALLGLSACSRGHEPRHETLEHGRFERLELSVPDEPRSVLLLLSGPTDQALADRLSEQASREGAIVTRIDAGAFAKVLDTPAPGCVFPSGDLDNLAHFVQAYLKLPRYEPAILVGLGAGAGIASGALMQAPQNTFAGAIVFDFCGSSDLHAAMCAREGLHPDHPPAPLSFSAPPSLSDPLVRLRSAKGAHCPAGTPAAYATGTQDVAAFGHAYASLAAAADARAESGPTDLQDLPIVEVHASGPQRRDAFGILLSGDGGWAGIDKALSTRLAAQGLPIVGIDSLRYFWNERTPEGTAADLDRVIRRYQSAWKRKRVVLIGYSQGADVLPFIVNRLSASSRASLVSAVALSLSTSATFEFHISSWMGASGDRPTLPEMLSLAHGPVVCVYGTDDKDALCPQLDPNTLRVIALPGSHDFNGDYDRLSSIVLGTLAPG